MQTLLQSYKAQAITLIFIWIVAMLFSAEFLLSQAMILLVALAVFQLKIDGQRVRFGIRDSIRANFRRCYSNKAVLAVTIPFLLVLVTALWSGDLDYTMERLRIKAPFLILPFAFMSIPRFKRRELLFVLYFLVLVMFVASIYVGLNYLANFEAINDMIGRGKPIPTPSNHIRFSLVLGTSILAGGALFHENFYLRYSWERYLIGGITLFLFAFIHVLSVRSGLVVLYISMLCLGSWYVYHTRRYALGAGLVMAMVLLPIIAYQTIPSFQTKLRYAQWDLRQYMQGTGKDYSDSERITSVEVGLKIGNQHPFIGVGAGDLKSEVRRLYAGEYGDIAAPKMPHNQFVSIYAGTGLSGLLIFLIGFFYPLYYQKNYKNILFVAFHIIIFFSFMMENTIENNFGVSFYLLFLLLGLNYLDRRKEATLQTVAN
ncbi:MAG: O-antigen ligase family protein [Phaeodactylibacter sp.]|nr:O-antigen ligase family protein [Phaeodactylibacter sp.]